MSACELIAAQIPQRWNQPGTLDHVQVRSTDGACYIKTNDGAVSPVWVKKVGTCEEINVYNSQTGECKVSDGYCLAQSAYTKKVQFSFSDGATVFALDPDIKDGCIYEPGEPKNCTETSCDVEMKPVGNDDMSDNSGNPDRDIQDYLDELAKNFKCEKTENGTVGCTNAEQTTPDVDPDDKCPDGYSWSGTACFPTTGNGNENPDGGGSSGGGSSSGGGDGGSSGGGSGGEGAGEGDGSSSGGGGGNNGNGDDGTDDGLTNSLEEPKAGNWDGANSEWDERLEQAKAELKEKVRQNTEALKGVFDLNLGTGGGSLPCDSFTLFGRPMSLCFDSYTDTLAGMRNALLLVASVIAAFVILKD
ncbi:hypothetical protein VV867_11750 [Pseudomonas sp. JH-2]|uniref:hypothetical protein n=1 Tax=Pseudomonas sp. JH-2 TaxID=3114998 RepID=UPI002E25F421|nr:hypothetical protein [Pseudomonas sp. JH-2]